MYEKLNVSNWIHMQLILGLALLVCMLVYNAECAEHSSLC